MQEAGGLLGVYAPSLNPPWGCGAGFMGRREPKLVEQGREVVRAGL